MSQPDRKVFRCPICLHEKSGDLDQALLMGLKSQQEIADLVGCARRTVYNHLNLHITKDLASLELGKRDSLIKALGALEQKTEQIIRDSMKGKLFDTAIKAIARREAQIKLVAELTGALQEKAPNEETEKRKQDQFDLAIQGMLQRAKQEGIPLTPKQAFDEMVKLDPELARFAKKDWNPTTVH